MEPTLFKMTTTERLKSAETMEEVLQILKITDYLPNFQSANIVQASALTLLKEADLKAIGIDNIGRQKLLRAIRCLLENIPAKDELLRCQVELNVKRNELARLQKRAKITKELFEMVDLTKQRMTTLRKRVRPCASPSLLQMATEMERILNDVIIAIHQAETCIPSEEVS
ncbi:unnamed protein product [Gongylonema pulchrum]|uniref:SAM domain-containing protein n=1 Tax=Gongylonema pulchrum TaxID=637853 RepID=A0A183E877_9BILA|nr:unnamed protein product [Gongylonema pulchrum]